MWTKRSDMTFRDRCLVRAIHADEMNTWEHHIDLCLKANFTFESLLPPFHFPDLESQSRLVKQQITDCICLGEQQIITRFQST